MERIIRDIKGCPGIIPHATTKIEFFIDIIITNNVYHALYRIVWHYRH